MHHRWVLVTAALLVAACSTPATDTVSVGELPPLDGAAARALLVDLDRPAVVNVWASWCLPCRSETPLLAAADRQYGDLVRFIGVDVRDNQADAQAFIAEFGLNFEHYFDPDGAVPAELGGFGVPITYFFRAGGELVDTHSGIIDEQTLALMLDELIG